MEPPKHASLTKLEEWPKTKTGNKSKWANQTSAELGTRHGKMGKEVSLKLLTTRLFCYELALWFHGAISIWTDFIIQFCLENDGTPWPIIYPSTEKRSRIEQYMWVYWPWILPFLPENFSLATQWLFWNRFCFPCLYGVSSWGEILDALKAMGVLPMSSLGPKFHPYSVCFIGTVCKVLSV